MNRLTIGTEEHEKKAKKYPISKAFTKPIGIRVSDAYFSPNIKHA